MASAYFQHSSYRRQLSPRRRATALGLALALVALLVLALLRLGATSYRAPSERSLSTFTVLPEGEQVASHPRQEARRARAKASPPPAAKPLPPAPLPNPAAPGMIVLSRDEMASADIGKMAHAPSTDGAADAGGDSGAAGVAPGGQKLYNAEWYREPPPNALALYLPNGAPAGAWATIACRTIDRYHVDSCQQLDDYPKGLGLSRAVRQAAWQFLVRPPRLGGKPLVGAWVRIRFTFEKPPAS